MGKAYTDKGFGTHLKLKFKWDTLILKNNNNNNHLCLSDI